jgi:hypothetical protein
MLYELAGRPPLDGGALMGACETQNAEQLALILELGAEPGDGDWRAAVAMLLETYSRNPPGKHACLELLATRGIPLPDTPTMAVHRGRIDLLAQHLDHDPGLLGRTFAHVEIFPPALGCHADEHLAFHGAPLGGATLLHMAIDYGEIEIVEWLLDRGMDVNVRAAVDADGFGGHTPLFSAVVSYWYYVRSKYASPKPDDDAFAELLLARGADPNARASLRSRMHDEVVHEYRDVTPLAWGRRFHDQQLVSRPALRMIQQAGGAL